MFYLNQTSQPGHYQHSVAWRSRHIILSSSSDPPEAHVAGDFNVKILKGVFKGSGTFEPDPCTKNASQNIVM